MVTAEMFCFIPKISEECSKFIDDNFPKNKQYENISRLSNSIYIFHSGFSGGHRNPEIAVIMDKKNKDWLIFRRYDVEKLLSVSKTYDDPKQVMAALKKLQQKQA